MIIEDIPHYLKLMELGNRKQGKKFPADYRRNEDEYEYDK